MIQKVWRQCLDMQQPDKRTSLLFFLVRFTSSFFSRDMPSPNKASVGIPVGFPAEKGNGLCSRQKGQTCYLSWELNKTERGRERDLFCDASNKKLFCIIWIVYISICVVCLANCFRCLGLGGSDSRHGLLYSNASLLFLQGTGFSIAPTTTKQKTKAPTSRDLIASGFVKTRFTNVHQRLYASVLCTSCFGSTSFWYGRTLRSTRKKMHKLYCIIIFSPNTWIERTNT